jgi:hypothetical protein
VQKGLRVSSGELERKGVNRVAKKFGLQKWADVTRVTILLLVPFPTRLSLELALTVYSMYVERVPVVYPLLTKKIGQAEDD